MNKEKEFDFYDIDRAIKFAEEIASKETVNDLLIVLRVALSDYRNLPNLGFQKYETIPMYEYLSKWIERFDNGYFNRPSIRKGNPSKTFSDPIIRLVLKSRLPSLNDELEHDIINGHSLLMTIENLVGDFLEEFLSLKLKDSGWVCCWGNTIDAVDFCHSNGRLLQIKNSDNSENSSSSRVRAGTQIEKWVRRRANKQDFFLWDKLQHMIERDDLTEDNFRAFIEATIQANPNCLLVSPVSTLNRFT